MIGAPFISKPTDSEFNLAWFRGRPLREPILFDSSELRPGANGLGCAVPGCETYRYVAEPLSPNARYICKRHPRQIQVKALQTYVPERRDYDSKKDRQDARAHFQAHLSHAVQTFNTSASLRWLIEPNSPPQFLKPTPEELERLRAASAEYDRRIQDSYARTKRILSSYLPPHTGEVFQLSPTTEQIEEWNRNVRDGMLEDYHREREQADVMLQQYIAELQRELRRTDDLERRTVLRQRIVELLSVDPFHLAEPKTAPEISLIETELGDQGMTRIEPFPDEDGEYVDVFELIPGDSILPKAQKRRVRLTLERITKTYIECTTRARRKRIEKLIQHRDPNALRQSKDFQKLLAPVLVLNEGLEPWQVALIMGESTETVRKAALRLYKKALAMQVTETQKVA